MACRRARCPVHPCLPAPPLPPAGRRLRARRPCLRHHRAVP